MDKRRIREYFDSLADTPMRFSPYAVLKTGLISGQTMLSLDEYTLICSPYQATMKTVTLLLILNPDETRFFQRYKDSSCILNLTFEKPGASHTLVFDVRGTITRIGPLKNRQNVCMIEIILSTQSEQLTEILGDFIVSHNTLKGYYDNFQGSPININENMARMLRYNNFMEIFISPQKLRSELISLSVKQLEFDLSSESVEILEGDKFAAKLYFQLYQFVVKGTIEQIEGYQASTLRVHGAIAFAPELIEIMDDYFYRLTHSTVNLQAPPVASPQQAQDL